MSLISVKNVTKRFGELSVLNGINLDIEKGDFLSIVGASGSGKSTLLTILGGIDKPTDGQIFIDGEDITEFSEKQLAILRRTKIGFVFQFFNLAPYLTAAENILLPLALDKKNLKAAAPKLNQLAEYLGISHILDKVPSTLSGGEQQRVAIARGLIFDPQLILLDEPTGNLDSASATGIMELLKSVNHDIGTTIVQVTHSQQNSAYGNRLITIKDGMIVE